MRYRTALRIQRDLLAAHVNLGNALFAMPGRMTEAVAELEAALRSKPDFDAARVRLRKAQSLVRAEEAR